MIIVSFIGVVFLLYRSIHVAGLDVPASCNSTQYYEPSTMMCQSCPLNASMVASDDGFYCVCAPNSIPLAPSRCHTCNVTEMLSADGRSCVPRRCQTAAGRTACRKCPGDYISVTQNLDGTPTKELQCVKCARGYRASDGACVRCEACACARQEVVVRGRCVPKGYVHGRPKYEQSKVHPIELLEVVKEEYFCTQNDLLACRALARDCVMSFYSADAAGPCRLWVQKIPTPKGLPKLTLEATSGEKDPSDIGLSRGLDKLHFVSAIYTTSGGLKTLYHPEETTPCFLPLAVQIGKDFSADCRTDVSQLKLSVNETLAPFLSLGEDLLPLPIVLRQPTGQYVQRASWPSGRFRRYFLIHDSLSITANVTDTVYLRTLLIKLRIERSKLKSPPLHLRIALEAQYASKSPLAAVVTTTLRVEHEMPSAGVLRGLEIWGGVLGALLSLYALAQWRGNLRRGGPYFSLAPYLAGAVADSLYFAALFSTLHALAAEAGTLGLTLPLSASEDHMVQSFVYSAVGLKTIKVLWVNYSQCKCDVFFLDWSEYNPPLKDTSAFEKTDAWRCSALASEWSRAQTVRRACPAYTVTLTLVILHFLRSWQSTIPESRSYLWAACTLAWWAAYAAVVAMRWGVDKAVGSPTLAIPRLCKSVGISLLVFEEDFYAHYVHGRNDDSDARSLTGPLAACRVVCAPQLRAVYKQLSTPGTGGLGERCSNKVLLTKFLAAFFERALDGLSWVASERTLPERLLDVELVVREAGNTSALLYDAEDTQPSCFALTWWGEEWTLGTLDAVTFGCVVMATTEPLYAAVAVLTIWQVMKLTRSWFGNKNQIQKTGVEIPIFFS